LSEVISNERKFEKWCMKVYIKGIDGKSERIRVHEQGRNFINEKRVEETKERAMK
jgi:hypothetical protein